MSVTKPRIYKTLTLAEKIAAIKEVEKGAKKKSEIAKAFGIPPNTLSTFLKNKDKILACENKSVKGRKRLREPENPDLDQCVLKWFKQTRDKKIPISGPLLRSKAEQFAADLGKTNFKASTGWLDGFKQRNKISFKSICGESGAVNQQQADQWKKDLEEMIQDRNPKDIFNVDETGLFFKCTPDKTLAFKDEKCHGGKLSKERITLLVGANMDGTEKLPLLMVGKSANPRCFKNVKSKPVDYVSSSRAWMTGTLFENWLLKLDKKFKKEKRKVIVFIDNCTAHNTIPLMENIKVIFFPANMTSVIQPMDQGIIKNLKHFYRRLLVQNILIGDDNALKIKLDLLQASRMCKQAWDQVTPETIQNCFKKAGFIKNESEKESFIETAAETVPSIEDWNDVITNPAISYEDFVNVDEDVAVCGEMTDADIIADVMNEKQNDGDNASGDELEEDNPTEAVPSAVEAANHLRELRHFVESRNDVSNLVFHSLNVLDSFIMTERLNCKKQLKISTFFEKQ